MPICLQLLLQAVRLDFSFAWLRAGSSIAAKIAMMAITTSSSIKVKARPLVAFGNRVETIQDEDRSAFMPVHCDFGYPMQFLRGRQKEKPGLFNRPDVAGLHPLLLINRDPN